MFEVGKRYQFVTNDHNGETSFTDTVLEVEMPLIKIGRDDDYKIINVASSLFSSAELYDPEAQKLRMDRVLSGINVKFQSPDDNNL